MNFNSIIFAIFMGIVFFIYWMISDQYRWMVVLLVSCCFYIGFGIFFFVLLGIVTVFSYLAGLAVGVKRNKRLCKIFFIVSIVSIICILAYFKYAAFIVQTVNSILKTAVIQLHPFIQKIALPVGISFYSFKALS